MNDNLSSVLTDSETVLFPVAIYLLKVKNKNTRKQCEVCPKLTKRDTRTMSIDINTQLTDVALVSFFFLNFEHILLLILLFLMLNLNW